MASEKPLRGLSDDPPEAFQASSQRPFRRFDKALGLVGHAWSVAGRQAVGVDAISRMRFLGVDAIFRCRCDF